MLCNASLRCMLTAEIPACAVTQSRNLGRRMPNQGKPPILPPSKKVLYHVVHVPWQSPEEVKELLWRRHVYNNAVHSLKEVFRQELRQAEAAGKGLEAMKEEEDAELNRLIEENERINREKADARARKEDAEWKETQREILEEIDEALQKQHQMARDATIEVEAAIARSHNFVNEVNLEAKILEALENPKVYDFAIDRQGKKIYDPVPVKYQEGVPTRQKGRLFDKTLGLPETSEVEEEGKAKEPSGV